MNVNLVLVFAFLYYVPANNISVLSEYDQEIPQSHTADQPTAQCRRAGDKNSTSPLVTMSEI